MDGLYKSVSDSRVKTYHLGLVAMCTLSQLVKIVFLCSVRKPHYPACVAVTLNHIRVIFVSVYSTSTVPYSACDGTNVRHSATQNSMS